MRTIYIILALFLFSGNSYSQNGWVSVNPSAASPDLNNFNFINSNTGWACGRGGTILKTSNAGVNWISQNYDGQTGLNKIFFSDEMHGWTAGSQGKILKTTNGGINWQLITYGSKNEVVSIYFLNSNTEFIGNIYDSLFITTNAGLSWSLNLKTGFTSIYDLKFFDINTGIAYGSSDNHYKTTNGGVNWTPIPASQFSQTFSSEYLNENTGWVSTSNAIWRTTNSGLNWVQQLTVSGINQLSFINGQTGYSGNQNGKLYKTTNGGLNWNILNPAAANVIRRIKFTDSNTGFILNGYGRILKTTDSGLNWTPYVISFIDKELITCKFFPTGTGYAGGYSTLLKTTNGGENFVVLTDRSYNVFGMHFFNETTGWICGGSGLLLKTTNGGTEWKHTSINEPNAYFYTIYFLNQLTGFTAGSKNTNPSIFYKTTDGGESWINYNTNAPFAITSVWFTNSMVGLISGYGTGATYLRTTNGGVNWSAPILNQGVEKSLFFINEQTGWAATYNRVVKTTNGGVNWFSSLQIPFNFINSVHFVNELTGWCSGSGGVIYRTSDGGTTWTNQSFVYINELNSINFLNATTGFAVGTDGTILKTTNGGLSFVNGSTGKIPIYYSLRQNYPNPFNPSTTINYELPITNFVSIKVFDVLGNEVETLVNEKQNAGSYSADFNAASLPSGIYFYKLVTEKFSETKKMILIK
jgi:photosystem II stability/assembly factor-like uncharacterized protein